jgi:hypothetical protein
MTKPFAPKFTQIACSTTRDPKHGEEKENLYALDSRSRVWAYVFPPGSPVGWVLLPDDNHEPVLEKAAPEKT